MRGCLQVISVCMHVCAHNGHEENSSRGGRETNKVFFVDCNNIR